MKNKPFSPAGEQDPETAASIIDSCVQFCDLIIAGKERAVALKYDEENMFAPMIVLLENDASACALVRAAERLDIPVINNVSLAKNLSSCGKSGETIPEACFRDVSLVFARLGRSHRNSRGSGKCRQGIPVKIPRPLSIELGESLFALTGEGPGREKLLLEPLNCIRKKLMALLGITIPFFRVFHKAKLKKDEYRILFKGLEAGRGRLELGWYTGVGTPQAAIPDIVNNPDTIRAAILNYHNDPATLQHALRWGLQAAKEIREDWPAVVAGLTCGEVPGDFD